MSACPNCGCTDVQWTVMICELHWLRAGELTLIGQFGFATCPRVGDRVRFKEGSLFQRGTVLEVEHDQYRSCAVITMAQGLPSSVNTTPGDKPCR